jgi:signal transduction histidine kinase
LQAQASRLEQVLTNLLINATKFTGKNGAISVTVGQTDAAISIHVCDTGIGISPELLPRIFQAYQQGPLARLSRRGGLGIGLALVKSIVELHGGNVTAKSEGPGMGAEFIVNLPLTVQCAQAPLAPYLSTLPSPFIDDA